MLSLVRWNEKLILSVRRIEFVLSSIANHQSLAERHLQIDNIRFLMKHLLYCIFNSSDVQRQAALPGVDGQSVFPVAINGISAAVSEIGDAHLAPDIPRAMAYQKVIASFHSDRTVIPMRYGCVLGGRPQVIQFLNKNARRYESLLKELDGCVEMGIRLMIDDCRLSIEDLRNPKSKITGQAYLAARKAHYAQEDRITAAKTEIITQFRAAFAGLFVKSKVETTGIPHVPSTINNQPSQINNRKSPINHQQSTINNQLLSLYFLVPGKSIDPFRRVFRHLHSRMETTKLLLSGPWPPYNFVLPDNDYEPKVSRNHEY